MDANTVFKHNDKCSFNLGNIVQYKKKTKVLVCRRDKTLANVCLEGERLELVESFTYLGSTITWDGRSRSDFKH
jgi:hypothetical protein